MDSIKMMTEPSDTAAEMDENGGCDIKVGDNEEKAELSAIVKLYSIWNSRQWNRI